MVSSQPFHPLLQTIACPQLTPPAVKENIQKVHEELERSEEPDKNLLTSNSSSHSKSSNAEPLSPKPAANQMRTLRKENLLAKSKANEMKSVDADEWNPHFFQTMFTCCGQQSNLTIVRGIVENYVPTEMERN